MEDAEDEMLFIFCVPKVKQGMNKPFVQFYVGIGRQLIQVFSIYYTSYFVYFGKSEKKQ